MALTLEDRRLVAALEGGLPLVAHPYREIGERAGLSEAAVIRRIKALIEQGVITRHGVVVRHRALGYRANAMVVWDIDDGRVAAVGETLAAEAAVTLCYRRPRRLPDWPYNLFCMIHGRDHAAVTATLAAIAARNGLENTPRAVLFSRRCFKQRGARYTHMDRNSEPRWTTSTAAS